MNPLKNLFNKVFDSAPAAASTAVPKEDAAFEWNPDAETVAPTSAHAVSWRRGDTPDPGHLPIAGEASTREVAASANSLPSPLFEKPNAAAAVGAPVKMVRPLWNEPDVILSPSSAEEAPFVSLKPVAVPMAAASSATPEPVSATVGRVSSDNWVKASAAEVSRAVAVVAPPQSLVPLSDFEEVYRKAGIKSPVHGYGVERVYRLLTSRRLVGLDRTVRRSALLTALDAAGVPPSDVSQDAVLRRKALTAYEAEKALELQSLRSRNESRAEALQDTVETFTRQKQGQIERLAQGSTSAVRAQSDLEIRKRMEQDRLYRSLAYFVEPLPSPSTSPSPSLEARAASPEVQRVIDRFDATIEMRPAVLDEAIEPVVTAPRASTPTFEEAPAVEGWGFETKAPQTRPPDIRTTDTIVDAVTITPTADFGDTRPLSQSGLEMALRAAAEEARTAGWGRTALVEDSAAVDAVDALRKLREAKKTDSES